MNDTIIGLQPEAGAAAPASASAGELVKNSDQSTFMADVIEASKEMPVLVDFWAPWCGPCKQLGPIIEKAVIAAGGKIKLVKVNIDENEQIAQQMRVQSIPAVFAFIDGQPVDGFMGAKPEGEIKAFIDKIVALAPASPVDQIAQLLEQAKTALDAGQVDEAGQIYAAVLQSDNESVPALCGLARCQIAKDDLEAAKATLANIAASFDDEPDVISVKAALELAANKVDDSEITALVEKVSANPQDFDARFELANALNSSEKRFEALDQLLYIVAKNRGWNDEAARKQVLTFFESWGPMDEHTIAGRKQLSAILFS